MIDHGRPTAAELVAAVAEFLETEVVPTGAGPVGFHARVAANVLHIVERELARDDGPALPAALGADDEARLAAAIRDGRLDERGDEVLPALRRLVSRRLAVAHPGYAAASIADRLFAAMEAGDVDAVAAMWAPDIEVWRAGTARPRDKSRALRVIDWFVAASADRHYQVLSRQEFDTGFVQQHVLSGRCRDGTPYAMRVAMIVAIGPDGLIKSIDEYLDPADLAPLLESERSRR